MANETVIKGGTVYDGTGAPGVRADVGIAGGRVTEVGPNLDGYRVLDAGDCVVAPGFIDIHTHYDAQVFWDPALTPSCFHGVTTVVAGNCGFSIAPTRAEHHELIARTLENVEDMDVAALAAGIPWDFASFPEYLASVRKHGVGINFTAYIGHTALRLFVMGDAAYERTATPEEIAEMQRVLREAMDAGAAGFATSFASPHRGIDGKPVPSRFADRQEFEALLETMSEVGRGIVSVAPGDQCPVGDMFDLQMKAGVPFTWGALLTSPGRDVRVSLDANAAGWDRGAEVWPQVTPRPLTFTFTLASPYPLAVNESFAALQNASVDERTRAYADPEWRAEMKTRLGGAGGFGLRWDTYTFGASEAHPELVDRKLIDVAGERNSEPLDCLLDLALDEPGLELRVRTIIANDDEAGVADLLVDEHCTLGLSDAGAHAGQLCDAPQATDLLGNWVRDKGVVPMELAIRKLSGLQADLFGFEDRGYLRPGAFADVAVFDPATVAPGPVRRVRDFPAGAERLTADAPVGMHHVVVNGTPIRADGESTNAGTVGQVVKPTARP
ncbi:MAG TPA: amidohydrolase family protein [Acidimicrobiia bacterium]|nr:amidohydrolase family protein [Acidimicrobiia bacterium]